MPTKQETIAIIRKEAKKYNAIWIEEAGIGILVLGVVQAMIAAQSRPKSLECLDWVLSIWQLYYQRYSIVMQSELEDIDLTDDMIDFTSCGPMPWSVPELMTEILGE